MTDLRHHDHRTDDAPPSDRAPRLLIASSNGLIHADGRTEFAGHDITDVDVDGDRVAVLVDRVAVHRREADGSWVRLAELGDGPHRTLAWHGDGLLVGGSDARLWRVSEAGGAHRIESFDRAPSHEGWHTPWGGPPDVFSIASDCSDAFVNVHVGGILRSTDLENWTPTIDLHEDVHDVTVDEAGTIWAATGARGLARSTDRGASWTHVTAGLHATYARAVATTGGVTLVSVSSGPFARDGAIYRLDGDTL
ncbi:MAG: hypothetical protein AAFP84_18850, partial [Actinomycetota bacterium]